MRKVDSRGESAARLARNIACVKYTLFCFNIVAWVSRLWSASTFNWKNISILIGACSEAWRNRYKNLMKSSPWSLWRRGYCETWIHFHENNVSQRRSQKTHTRANMFADKINVDKRKRPKYCLMISFVNVLLRSTCYSYNSLKRLFRH